MSQQINLFNPVFLKQKKVLTAVHMVQILGVLALLMVAWAAYTHYLLSGTERQAQVVRSQLLQNQSALEQAVRQYVPRAKSPSLEQEVKLMQTQLQSLQEIDALLRHGTLGNTAGYAEYFRAFARQSVPGLWLTGVVIVGAGNQIALQGRAMQATLVPSYIARLKDEASMRGKTFARLEIGQPELGVAGGDGTPAAADAVAPLQSTPPAVQRVAAQPRYIEFLLQSQAEEQAR
ncbi:hypothetical protein [Massilia sp. NR 4-1]|uniref:hypothetical protein n=1 Tax=Massilia sp. NR 4-1 TaxID=1678028 RepID=UPI00067D6FFA|nr:hypothetical protein [Massilia sp. NR 4-1]AKU21353.1 hypothetical protein ACZ75_07530 [Massilia sp. NR 4-1]